MSSEQTTDRPHSTLECNNLDMDKIRSHLDGDFDRLLAFKTQWLRMHLNAYKGPLVSSTSSRRQGSSKPNKTNKKRQLSDDRHSSNLSKYGLALDPKRIDQRRQVSIATYAKLRASPKTNGQAITPETVRITPIPPERISNEDFESRAKVVTFPSNEGKVLRGNTANDSYYTSSGGYATLGRNLDDDNRMDEDDPRD
jgi:hypothetical protein